jgi:hypothetical protein
MKRSFQIPNAGTTTWLSSQAWEQVQPFPVLSPVFSCSDTLCSPISPESFNRSTDSYLPKTLKSQRKGAVAEILPVSYRPYSSGRTNLLIEGRW